MAGSDFFGRIGELETLQDAYESTTAEMAIIYGRRRIGKTAVNFHSISTRGAQTPIESETTI